MKKVLHRIILFIISLFCNILSYRTLTKIRAYRNIYHSRLLRRDLKSVGKFFSIEPPYSISGAQYMTIGNNFSSFARLRLDAIDTYTGISFQPEIIIGDNVSFNFDCHLACVNKIVIGNNVLLASRVFITDHFHGQLSREQLEIPPVKRQLYSKGPVIIEDNVWIGEGVSIMPGVRIGQGAIIGANSVITRDVPPYAVIGGVPGRILKQL